MKFVRRDMGEAAEASNPGSAGLRREIAFLPVATATLLLVSYFAIGWAVELVLPRISVERERRWFSDVTLGVHTVEPADVREIERLAAARAALEKLRPQPGVPPLAYRLVLVRDATPNAFAFPGGTIGLTQGMLELADDEIALAFVIAHELGHFAQRDHLRGIGRALGRALVWTIVFGDASDLLSRNAGTLLDLAHSRRQETGADRFGLALVQAAYGRTEGSDRVFLWLERNRKSPAWAQWLQTHPDSGDRVQRLREGAKKLGP